MIDRGFTESVRNMWVLSLTHSARLDSALKDFADLERLLSNENKELGKKRRVLDVKDTTSFYSWLSTRNPFLIEDEKLYSLGTGVVSEWHDDVNCERAEELGIFIQSTFDNKPVKQCCVKRSNVDHLLFTHAWSGCDTTSSIFGKGKAFAVKMLRKSAQLRECSTIITSVTSTPIEVGQAAITAFKIFYGAPTRLKLSEIR